MARFRRSVYLLAAISFFTDLASEMLYPVVPIYLAEVGYSVLFVGLMEGVAQLVVGLVRIMSGAYADVRGRHVALVRIGYGLGAVTKPVMGMVQTFLPFFGLRLADRFGKGLRGTPRDALLMDASQLRDRGKVFGFHRAIDTAGAALGPVVALLLLVQAPDDLQRIFYWAAVPGVIAVSLTFLLREKRAPSADGSERPSPWRATLRFAKNMDRVPRRLLTIFAIVALLKSTDMFLLLRAKELGLSTAWVIGVYVAFNVMYAIGSYVMGWQADRRGFRQVYLVGLAALATTYGILALRAVDGLWIAAAFVIYGVFAATYDGLTAAWMSLHVPDLEGGTGLGVLFGAQAVAGLVGSLVIATAWVSFGAQWVFLAIALACLLLIAIMSNLELGPVHGEAAKGGCTVGH